MIFIKKQALTINNFRLNKITINDINIININLKFNYLKYPTIIIKKYNE